MKIGEASFGSVVSHREMSVFAKPHKQRRAKDARSVAHSTCRAKTNREQFIVCWTCVVCMFQCVCVRRRKRDGGGESDGGRNRKKS